MTHTPAPWTVKDHSRYLEIRGPNDEAIATIFPKAGNGGVGIDAARANANLIVALLISREVEACALSVTPASGELHIGTKITAPDHPLDGGTIVDVP